jgi:hypothetical protein
MVGFGSLATTADNAAGSADIKIQLMAKGHQAATTRFKEGASGTGKRDEFKD